LVNAWLDLADIAIKNKRADLAKTYLKTVKYLEPKNYKYYYYTGLINKQQGNKDVAKANFEQSITINPMFVDATNELNALQ